MSESTIPFISEDAIEQAATSLNAEDAGFEKAIDELEAEQPQVLGYFFAENTESFTQAEREYMLLLLLVVWRSIKNTGVTPPLVSADELEEAEDRNWELVQDLPAKAFSDRLDVFFDNYPQEDLLAFLEDALSPDEEDDELVTKEGREALFVSLKSVVDCWTGWS